MTSTDDDANPISVVPSLGVRDAKPTGARARPRGRRREERLAVDDWVRAALDLVMREGIGAVRLQRLCTDFNVTKGSFYWHFSDLDDLRDAMAIEWARRTREAHDALVALRSLQPTDRIRQLADHLVDDEHLAVERFLRDWAHHNPRVMQTVAESDGHVFTLVRDALAELGFDAAEAESRAALLIYAAAGFAGRQASLPVELGRDHLRRALDVVLSSSWPHSTK